MQHITITVEADWGYEQPPADAVTEEIKRHLEAYGYRNVSALINEPEEQKDL